MVKSMVNENGTSYAYKIKGNSAEIYIVENVSEFKLYKTQRHTHKQFHTHPHIHAPTHTNIVYIFDQCNRHLLSYKIIFHISTYQNILFGVNLDEWFIFFIVVVVVIIIAVA